MPFASCWPGRMFVSPNTQSFDLNDEGRACDQGTHFLAILGLYVLICYLYDSLKTPLEIAWSVIEGLLYPERKLDLIKKFGSWAVITGATDGIGKAYAKELAKKGLNIVLISRTKEKLINCAKEIENEFGVKVKWIQADFAKGPSLYAHIERELEDIPVGILINNVGCHYGELGKMADFSEETLWNVMNTNIGAVTIMCRTMINKMWLNRGGAIVNISSCTESQPGPYGAIYAASKAYMKSLTHALQHELKGSTITIQLLSPFFIVTKLNSYSSEIMRGGLTIPTAETFARWAVFTLGRTNQSTGYFMHGILRTLVNMFPYRLRRRGATIIAENLKINQMYGKFLCKQS